MAHSLDTSMIDEKPRAAISDAARSDAEKGVVAAHVHKHHDPNWTGSDVDFRGIDEAKVLRKMDIRLIPVLAVLYLLCFLDRGNIGNAKIQGLTTDLQLEGSQYNLCLTVFFFTYCLFEVPSNLLLKVFRPSIWLPSIMVAWGTVMTLMGIVQNYHGLLLCRLFLGVAEAGLYPGVAYYLTMWYCTREIQYRQGLFVSAASIAGAFSGLLAYAIVKMNGVGGEGGWRWIFIIEGLLTVVVAFASFFLLYDFPDTASFLTLQERAWATHRLKYQGSFNSSRLIPESDHFEWKFVIRALTDWQLYVCFFVSWGVGCPLYGISFFLPSIINDLGYTAATAQLLTVPIYTTAAGLSIIVCIFSDKAAKNGRSRSPYIFWPMVAILVGFIITIAASARGDIPGVVYAGVFITTCGIYPALPGIISWISNNLAGSYKRATGMAFVVGIGNLSGAIASNFYRSQDAPKYILGHGLEIMFCVTGLIAVLVLRINYDRINKEKEAMRMSANGMTDVELSDLGDRAPTFKYQL